MDQRRNWESVAGKAILIWLAYLAAGFLAILIPGYLCLVPQACLIEVQAPAAVWIGLLVNLMSTATVSLLIGCFATGRKRIVLWSLPGVCFLIPWVWGYWDYRVYESASSEPANTIFSLALLLSGPLLAGAIFFTWPRNLSARSN